MSTPSRSVRPLSLIPNITVARFFVLSISICLVVSFLLVPVSVHGHSDTEAFSQWLTEFRSRVIDAGVSRGTVKTHLNHIQPDSRILNKSNNQAEFTTPFPEYKGYFVTDSMIEKGQALRNKHRDLLKQIENQYGVPAQILVAIWGIESRYGSRTNWHDPIPSMATLAFQESRRSDYFEGELITLLKLIDRDEIPSNHLKGSWAGALGQPQFMPSSYETYAVDFDGDGEQDIWTNPADILGSIAHYLAKNGWEPDQPWGTVLGDSEIASPGTRIVAPESADQSFEVYDNFDVLMTYNRSEFYALTVGILAEEIGSLENTSPNNG